jgi:molybdenum-dependent DNA-binding transcriptional regulator ModE
LTLKKRGGVSVGGSEVTAKAGELMKAYKSIRAEMATVISEAYKKHFGESIKAEYYAVLPQRRSVQYNREMAIVSQPHEEDPTFPPELHSEN